MPFTGPCVDARSPPGRSALAPGSFATLHPYPSPLRATTLTTDNHSADLKKAAVGPLCSEPTAAQRNLAWPEEVELRITLPNCLLETFGTAERAQLAISEEIDRQVSEAHVLARRLKRAFVGAARIRRGSPRQRSAVLDVLRGRNLPASSEASPPSWEEALQLQ